MSHELKEIRDAPLGAIIPVFNEEASLARVLRRVLLQPCVGQVVVVWAGPVVGMAVAVRARVLCPIVALVAVGMVIEVATAIAEATMVDVRVVATVIAAVLVAVISADNVARWVLDVAPVVLVALVGSAEKVVTDSGLQIDAGKQEVFMPFSIVK